MFTAQSYPATAQHQKIYFQDPFIFHACRGWVYGKRPFEFSQEFLSSNENKSKLVECVVSNHLSRFMFNMFPSSLFEPSNYVFYWANKRREVDFIIDLDGKFLPIEVKYSDNIERNDARGIGDFRKTGKSHDFGIITSKNRLEARRDYVVVPLPILLILA